jgi:hypothetical protein
VFVGSEGGDGIVSKRLVRRRAVAGFRRWARRLLHPAARVAARTALVQTTPAHAP